MSTGGRRRLALSARRLGVPTAAATLAVARPALMITWG